MKRFLIFVLLALMLTACLPKRPSVSLSKASVAGADVETNSPAQFEDDDVRITWQVNSERMGIRITNKGSSSIKIPWDQVVIVDSKGSSHRVMHSGVKFIDRDQSMVPSVIPAGASLDDVIHPSDKVVFEKRYGDKHAKWHYWSLVRRDAKDGSNLRLVLPIEMGEETREYSFTFDIEYPKEPQQ